MHACLSGVDVYLERRLERLLPDQSVVCLSVVDVVAETPAGTPDGRRLLAEANVGRKAHPGAARRCSGEGCKRKGGLNMILSK